MPKTATAPTPAAAAPTATDDPFLAFGVERLRVLARAGTDPVAQAGAWDGREWAIHRAQPGDLRHLVRLRARYPTRTAWIAALRDQNSGGANQHGKLSQEVVASGNACGGVDYVDSYMQAALDVWAATGLA